MTPNEFKNSSSRLIEAYGEKIFCKARLEIIFQAVKSIRADAWNRAVNEIIAEFVYAPPLSKMLEVVRVIQSRYQIGENSSPDGIVRSSVPIPDTRHPDLTPEERARAVANVKSLVNKAFGYNQEKGKSQ